MLGRRGLRRRFGGVFCSERAAGGAVDRRRALVRLDHDVIEEALQDGVIADALELDALPCLAVAKVDAVGIEVADELHDGLTTIVEGADRARRGGVGDVVTEVEARCRRVACLCRARHHADRQERGGELATTARRWRLADHGPNVTVRDAPLGVAGVVAAQRLNEGGARRAVVPL